MRYIESMEYAAIKSYVSKLLFQIQTEINISNSDECIGIDRALHMMRFIRPLCDTLRKHTVNYQFRDEAEEIYFFKELKPEVLSKYVLQLFLCYFYTYQVAL